MGEGRGWAGRESCAPSHACPHSGGPGSLGGAASIPAPSSPLPPTIVSSDSGREAGKAGAPAVQEAPERGSALLQFPLLYLEAYVTGMASQR